MAASSSSSGGLLGALSAIGGGLSSGLQAAGAPYGGIANLGAAMMQDTGANGTANYGKALLDAQNQAIARAQARQQLQMNQLALQRQLMMLPFMSAAMQQYLGTDSSGATTPAPQNGASGQGNPPGGTQPNGAPSNGSPPLAPAIAQRLAVQQRLRASGAASPATAPTGGAPPVPAGVPGAAPVMAPPMLAPPYRAPLLAGASPGRAAPTPGAPAAANAAPAGTAGLQSLDTGLPGAGTMSPALRRLKAAGALALLGFPNASTLEDVAKTQLQYNPQLATQMEAAKSQIAQDQLLLAQAQASGNPAMVRAMQTKLKTDTGQLITNGMSGTLRMEQPDGSWTIYQPGSGLLTNTKTGTSWLPGAVQAEQQRAAAQARGEAEGELEKVTDANGNEYYVPRSLLLGGASTGGATGSGNAAGGARAAPFAPTATLGPASEELLKSKGEQAGKANEEYQDQAEAGQQMLAQIAELRSSAADFSPGQFAESRTKVLQWLQSTGLITPKEMQSLGSAQAGQKIAIQLQAAATRQLGSREAAQVFQILGKSMPNLTLSPNGLDKVSAYMAGVARYNMARAQVAQARLGANDVNGVNAVRDDFIRNTNPTYFILASASPAVRQEMVTAMGPQAKQFLLNWNTAIKGGWAPSPGAYDGSNPGY